MEVVHPLSVAWAGGEWCNPGTWGKVPDKRGVEAPPACRPPSRVESRVGQGWLVCCGDMSSPREPSQGLPIYLSMPNLLCFDVQEGRYTWWRWTAVEVDGCRGRSLVTALTLVTGHGGRVVAARRWAGDWWRGGAPVPPPAVLPPPASWPHDQLGLQGKPQGFIDKRNSGSLELHTKIRLLSDH